MSETIQFKSRIQNFVFPGTKSVVFAHIITSDTFLHFLVPSKINISSKHYDAQSVHILNKCSLENPKNSAVNNYMWLDSKESLQAAPTSLLVFHNLRGTSNRILVLTNHMSVWFINDSFPEFYRSGSWTSHLEEACNQTSFCWNVKKGSKHVTKVYTYILTQSSNISWTIKIH